MTAANEYDVGETVEATVHIYVNNVLTDPSTLTFKYKDPAGAISTKVYSIDGAVSKQSQGVYQGVFPVTTGGDWYFGFFSTGTAAGAGWRRVHVRPAQF